jgi:uncharacterized protein (TIGR03437 family)
MQVVNSATLEPDRPLSPLMLVAAFGQFLGVITASAASPLDTLGNAQVLVAGLRAQVLYTSPTQINFALPAAVEPGDALIRIVVSGNIIAETEVVIQPASPAVFLRDADPARQAAAAINANGTANSQFAPARPGEEITLPVTGFGVLDDGAVVGAMVRLERRDAAVSRTATPGLLHVRVRIPDGSPTGQTPMAVFVNGAESNTVSVWVQ